jgi:hypothetical protein
MFGFLRGRGLDLAAAVLGGLVFELNGFFLTRISVPSYVQTGVWLPLLLRGVDRLVDGRPWGAPTTALAACLTVLGGHPQIAGLAFATTLAWAAFRGAEAPARAAWRGPLRATAWTGGLLAWGVALAGFQVLPFLELVSQSARSAVPLEEYRRAALPVVGLIQAVLPHAFGDPVAGTYWLERLAPLLEGLAERPWSLNFVGGNVHTGLAAPFLAVLALRRWSRRDTAFFAWLALAALGVLLGTPLLGLAHAVIPAFAASRPDRVAYLLMVAAAVLSAQGLDSAPVDGPRAGPRTRRALALVAAGLALSLALPWMLDPARREGSRRWLAEASVLWADDRQVLGVEALVALSTVLGCTAVLRTGIAGTRAWPVAALPAVLPMLWFGWGFNPATAAPAPGRTALVRQLAAGPGASRVGRILGSAVPHLPPNLVQVEGLDDVQGASALGLRSYVRLVEAADPGAFHLDKYFLHLRRPEALRLLDLLAAGLVLSDQALALPRLAEGPTGVTLFRNPGALPRFRVVGAAETAAGPADAARRLLDPAFDPRTTAVLTGGPAVEPLPLPGRPPDWAVLVQRFAPERIELEVRVDAPGLLVTAEVDYPGWRVRVDGQERPLLRVNAAFRGVAVPAGRHHVTFFFVSRSFRAGLGLSLLAVLAAVAARSLRRRAQPGV